MRLATILLLTVVGCGGRVDLPDETSDAVARDTAVADTAVVSETSAPSCKSNRDCASTAYCALAGACEGPGTCAPRPEGCDLLYAPVCGCDGKTYGNPCAARQAGMNFAWKGECPRESWRPLTPEQAECLGITRPVCAGCHTRDGVFYLRPKDAPPPPPDHSAEPDLLKKCGVTP